MLGARIGREQELSEFDQALKNPNFANSEEFKAWHKAIKFGLWTVLNPPRESALESINSAIYRVYADNPRVIAVEKQVNDFGLNPVYNDAEYERRLDSLRFRMNLVMSFAAGFFLSFTYAATIISFSNPVVILGVLAVTALYTMTANKFAAYLMRDQEDMRLGSEASHEAARKLCADIESLPEVRQALAPIRGTEPVVSSPVSESSALEQGVASPALDRPEPTMTTRADAELRHRRRNGELRDIGRSEVAVDSGDTQRARSRSSSSEIVI